MYYGTNALILTLSHTYTPNTCKQINRNFHKAVSLPFYFKKPLKQDRIVCMCFSCLSLMLPTLHNHSQNRVINTAKRPFWASSQMEITAHLHTLFFPGIWLSRSFLIIPGLDLGELFQALWSWLYWNNILWKRISEKWPMSSIIVHFIGFFVFDTESQLHPRLAANLKSSKGWIASVSHHTLPG